MRGFPEMILNVEIRANKSRLRATISAGGLVMSQQSITNPSQNSCRMIGTALNQKKLLITLIKGNLFPPFKKIII